MSKRIVWLSAVSVIALSSPVLAQQAQDASTVDDVIVTAQKRAQSVQDVPIPITVVSAEALANVGGGHLQDLTKLSPSLTITQGTDQNNNSVNLRGVGTSAFSIGVEPSILIVVDDVATGLPGQGFNDLQDIERVEVLRGPQSTLFGKAASAGVISITTRAPSDTLTANAEAMFTSDDEQRYTLGISGPLGDQLGFRLNGSVGRRINGRDSDSVRGKLVYRPNDIFDASLIGYYSTSEEDCCAYVAEARTPGIVSLFGTPSSVSLSGIVPGRDNFNIRVDPEPLSNTESKGGSLKMNLTLGDHTLTMITAVGNYHADDSSDFDGGFGPLLGLPNGLLQFGYFDGKTFSNELRLTSPSSGPLQYVVGVYYAKNEYERRFTRVGPVIPADWKGNTESETIAAFGQADLKLTGSTTLTGGLRWSNEDISFTYDRILNTPALPAFSTRGSDGESAVTGRLGVQQQLAPDIMAFAVYSRGYKGQAYDLTSSFTTPTHPASRPVESEHSDNYEIGIKSRLFDRRITLNVNAFWTDYENFQAQTAEPTLGGSLLLANVGALRTKGVEAEFFARLTDDLTFSANAAYVNAVVQSYPRAECYFGQTPAQGCVSLATGGRAQDLAGKRLANAPDWKANLGLDYFRAASEGPFNLFANLNYAWQSEVNFSLAQDSLLIQDSYGVANVSFGIEDRESGRYKATFFVRNLFDQHYFATKRNDTQNFAGNPYPNPATVVSVSGFQARDSARYFGVKLSMSY
jgi:iron complex outermembrane receptor protein